MANKRRSLSLCESGSATAEPAALMSSLCVSLVLSLCVFVILQGGSSPGELIRNTVHFG